MTVQTKETLESCFEGLLSACGYSARCADFLPSIARKPGPVTAADLLKICEKLDFSLTRTRCRPRDVMERDTPGILVLKKGAFLHMPGKEVPPDVLAQFTGEILAVRTPAAGNIDTGHLKRGHAIDWFWQPLMKFWPHYAEVLVISVFINIFAMALPIYTMNVYDRVVPNFAEATLTVLSVGIFMAIFFDFLLKTMRSYILEHIAGRMSVRFDTVLLDRFFTTSPQSLSLSIGEKVNIFRELQGVRDFYSSRLAPAIVDLPFALLFIAVIYMISPPLALVPVIACFLIMGANMAAQIPVKMSARKSFEAQQAKTLTLFEMLAGTETIRMFNAAGNRLMRWNMATAESADSSRRSQFIMTAAGNFSLMLTYLVNVFVIVVGVFCIHDGTLTVGGLVAATILAGRAVAPVINIAGVVSRFKETGDVLRTIDGIFRAGEQEEKRVRAAAGMISQGRMKGKIELRDLSFSYPQQAIPALSNVSATIAPGEKIGLLGKSGAGKSTLARMISQNLTPGSGSVLLDDHFISSIHPSVLSRNIAIVPQRSFFFSGTVRDNIVLGAPEIDQKRLEQAAALSGLDVLLRQSGAGFDAQVGENGGHLSGGLQQSIALARVFARDPAIVIFDEPLTGIDHTLESRIKESMKFFLQNRTFIMITHRTTLLPLVDRLIFIDRGRVMVDGARDDVMRVISGQG